MAGSIVDSLMSMLGPQVGWPCGIAAWRVDGHGSAWAAGWSGGYAGGSCGEGGPTRISEPDLRSDYESGEQFGRTLRYYVKPWFAGFGRASSPLERSRQPVYCRASSVRTVGGNGCDRPVLRVLPAGKVSIAADSMAAPLVLGVLGQHVRQNRLSAGDLGNTLKAEAPSFQRFLPAGFGSLLGGASAEC